MIVDFSQEFGHLQVSEIPRRTLKSRETRGGYLSKQNASLIPKDYRKNFVHSSKGFVEIYCKGY